MWPFKWKSEEPVQQNKPSYISDELVAAAKMLGIDVPVSALCDNGSLTLHGGLLLQAKIVRRLAEESHRQKMEAAKGAE